MRSLGTFFILLTIYGVSALAKNFDSSDIFFHLSSQIKVAKAGVTSGDKGSACVALGQIQSTLLFGIAGTVQERLLDKTGDDLLMTTVKPYVVLSGYCGVKDSYEGSDIKKGDKRAVLSVLDELQKNLTDLERHVRASD